MIKQTVNISVTSVSQEWQRATVARLKQVGKELGGAWGSYWALTGKLKQRKDTSNFSFETVILSAMQVRE